MWEERCVKGTEHSKDVNEKIKKASEIVIMKGKFSEWRTSSNVL